MKTSQLKMTQWSSTKLLFFASLLFSSFAVFCQASTEPTKLQKLLCKEWVQHNGPVDIGDVPHLKAELVTSISLHDDNSFEYFNGKNITGIWRFNAADSTLALKSKDVEQIFVLVFLNAKEMKLKSYFDKRKTEAGIIRFVANE